MNEPYLVLLNSSDVLRPSLADHGSTKCSAHAWKAHKLDRVLDEVASYQDIPLLTDAMDPVDCLGFCHGVPMWLHDVDVICDGEVDTGHRSRWSTR